MTAIRMITQEELERLKPNGLEPGMAWYCPWLYDPAAPEPGLKSEREKWGYLSRFYWADWSDKRPPICVVCPNGQHWLIDSKSSNGDGWKITGEPPLITASPSILVPGYHGFLQNGVFTADCEGRGPRGVKA